MLWCKSHRSYLDRWAGHQATTGKAVITSADVINPLLEAFFNKIRHPLNGYGTVLMDFVNSDLVEAVYGSNLPDS